MGRSATKTRTTALALCLAAAAMLFTLAGCGGSDKPTRDEVNAAYLRLAEGAREYTFTIDRATEHPTEGTRQVARQFRSFAGNVDYKATYLQTILWIGPVGRGAAVLQHGLLNYELTLRTVAKRARRRDRSLALPLRWVREAGAEARMAIAAWERTLEADLAS